MSVTVPRPLEPSPGPRTWTSTGMAIPAAVALITAATFAVRLSQMHQSLFGDELWTFQQIDHHSFGQMLSAIRPGPENAPPLYFILAWLSSKLGDPSILIRLPSLLLGVATIPLVYGIGHQALDARAGLVGALVLAVSPFSLYYGIEARPYATMAFFVALATLAALHAVRSGSWRSWALYSAAALGAMYSHYTAVFPLLALGLWTLWQRRRHPRAPLLAGACAMLLYLPWIPHLHSQELAIIGALHPLNLHNVRDDLAQLIPGDPLAPLHAIPTTLGLIALGVCLLGGLGSLLYSRRHAPFRSEPGAAQEHLGLVALMAVATPVGVLIYSLLATDIWDARDLYASAPAVALLIGALLVALPRALSVLAVALVLLTLVFGTVRALTPSWTRPPFRSAADYLDRMATPGDPVVMYPAYLSLDEVIVAQLQRPHRVLFGVPRRWPSSPPGSTVYVVRDERFDAALRIPVPHPAGFALVTRQRYGGSVPVTILGYRQGPGA